MSVHDNPGGIETAPEVRSTIHAIKRPHLIGLAVILILGAALRFVNLDISEFWYDEATLSTLAQNMAAGKALPLLGIPSSANIPNPPAGVYVLAVPYLFSKNPLVAVGFIALLNVIGIGLLWLIAHRYFSPRAAFVSGLLYAVSPWALLYSRKIWGQDMHTPLILAGFLLGLHGFVEGKRWAQALCLPVLVFAMQIHFAAWALLPAYIWLLWIGRRRISRGAVALSIALALLTLVPFFIGVTQSHVTLDEKDDLPGVTLLPLQHVMWLATGLGLGETHVFPPGAEFVSQYPVVGALWLAALPLMAIGVWRIGRRSRDYAVFLLLWGFAAPLSLISGVYVSQQHYFIPCIPVYLLLTGEGIVWLAAQHVGGLRLRWATVAAFGVIGITQIIDWRSFLAFVDTRYVPEIQFIPQGYSTPLHYLLDIRAQVDDDVMMIAGTSLQVLPIQWSPLLNGEVTCLREAVIADGGVVVLPDHPFSLLRAPSATPYEFAHVYKSARQIVFPLREGEGSYVLDQIETPPVWDGPELTAITPATFDGGVTLSGYRFADGRLYLEWSVQQPGAHDYQYFVHLLDSRGERIAQHDSSYYPGRYWCAGDRIITFIALTPPPETATLRVGMYRFEDGNIVGSSAYDDAGSAAPWVDISLATE